MIITCEECQTQYAVPSTAIPSEGKKVRCASCKHTWHQEPLEKITERMEEIQESPEAIEEIPEASNLPTIKKEVKAGIGLKVSFGVIMTFAIFIGILANHEHLPQLDGFYNAVGMKDYTGLSFEKFSVGGKRDDNKLNFTFNGNLVNNSQKTIQLSKIRVTVYSRGGNILSETFIEPPQDKIASGKQIELKPEVNNVSGNAERVVLDIGNAWELHFRD